MNSWTDKFVYKFGEYIQYLLAFGCLDFSEYISLIFFSPLPYHTIVLIFSFCIAIFCLWWLFLCYISFFYALACLIGGLGLGSPEFEALFVYPVYAYLTFSYLTPNAK